MLQHRGEYELARMSFTWPELPVYNFATEWFDGLAESDPDGLALWVIEPDGETKLTFRELADSSIAAAHLLTDLGLRRGDRILVVLGNCVPLWEIMLAAIRVGAVIIPATPQLAAKDLEDRIERGDAKLLVAGSGELAKFEGLEPPLGRILVGARPEPVEGPTSSRPEPVEGPTSSRPEPVEGHGEVPPIGPSTSSGTEGQAQGTSRAGFPTISRTSAAAIRTSRA